MSLISLHSRKKGSIIDMTAPSGSSETIQSYVIEYNEKDEVLSSVEEYIDAETEETVQQKSKQNHKRTRVCHPPTRTPSPPPIFTIPRYRRKRQMGPLVNTVKSMISKAECIGFPLEKCKVPLPIVTERIDLSRGRENVRDNMTVKEQRSVSPGLPSSRTSSCIDFSEVEFDVVSRSPEPLMPKIFGFDCFGREIEENALPDIKYAFADIKHAVHNNHQLEYFVENMKKLEILEEAKLFAEKNLANNHDTIPNYERETVEKYMRNVCEIKQRNHIADKDNKQVEKPEQKSEQRIRRKISFGSYPNNSVKENTLPRVLRYTWKGKLNKLKNYLNNSDAFKRINKHDYQGRTALHFAASWGCYKTVELLLRIPNIDINAQDEQGKTPLYKAVEVGDFNTVKLLVKAGANIRRPALDGRNVFEYALQELGDKYFEIIQYLYIDGGMHKERKEDAKITYLHLLALSRRSMSVSAVMEELIKCREFVNATEGHGRTPLILACQMGRGDLVKILIENGADVKHIDLHMKSAIQYAKPNTDCHKHVRIALERLSKKRRRTLKRESKDVLQHCSIANSSKPQHGKQSLVRANNR